MASTKVYRGGKVHVLSEQCASCIGRSVNDGRIRGLRPGRVAGMVRDARAHDSAITCHSTLYGQADGEAVCRWFFDLPHKPAPLQVAERLGMIAWDDPPEGDH